MVAWAADKDMVKEYAKMLQSVDLMEEQAQASREKRDRAMRSRDADFLGSSKNLKDLQDGEEEWRVEDLFDDQILKTLRSILETHKKWATKQQQRVSKQQQRVSKSSNILVISKLAPDPSSPAVPDSPSSPGRSSHAGTRDSTQDSDGEPRAPSLRPTTRRAAGSVKKSVFGQTGCSAGLPIAPSYVLAGCAGIK
ncbi:hypothetical protein T484DRAFT_1907037 [Baffinella frigidus]|nr:hypothetical protein T484DRAFT_1907037 [Cryptophyta sp. CCMP2293]|mmetsp:Transcript_2206/g.5095  ORF Transcript_2206/g.5095 Transcript_2206/m.5095 type:complete len:195 (+) Transcript_2206:45-629(+)